MEKTDIKVPGMSCRHCVHTVKSALSKEKGVESVEINLDTKLVSVNHGESIDVNTLKEVIRESGYTVE